MTRKDPVLDKPRIDDRTFSSFAEFVLLLKKTNAILHLSAGQTVTVNKAPDEQALTLATRPDRRRSVRAVAIIDEGDRVRVCAAVHARPRRTHAIRIVDEGPGTRFPFILRVRAPDSMEGPAEA